MYKDERDIFYYDIKVRFWNRKYKGVSPCPHHKLARALKEMVDADAAEFTQAGTGQAVYITAIRVYADRCELLFGFTDPNAADPTLNDRPLRKRRIVAKEGDEGIEHSAHAIWHYRDEQNNKACPFYLEGALGLSSSAVARFLNRLFRLYEQNDQSAFAVDDPSGAVDASGEFKQVRMRPQVELMGHPSSEFIRDLKSGEMGELELYTEEHKTDAWDANAYAIEEHRSVLLKPNPIKHSPKAKDVIDAVLGAKVKSEYELARVRFKTAGNVPRNVRFYSQNYQLINDNTYVKKSKLKDLGGNLPNAFDTFNKRITSGMRDLAKIKK